MTEKENELLQQMAKSIKALTAQIATLSAYVAATSPALSQAEVGRIVRMAQGTTSLRMEGAPGVIAERTVTAIAKGRASLEGDRK